jgi:hypothetical protein
LSAINFVPMRLARELQQIYFAKPVHAFRPINVSGVFVRSDYFPPPIVLLS